MNDENDEMIERVARALKPLPPVSANATARILAATRSSANRAPSRATLLLEWMRQPTLSFASGGMLLAAGLAVGFVTNSALSSLNEPASIESAQHSADTPVMAASNAPGAVRLVQMPMLLDAAGATNVSIIGDFNDWDGSAAPMSRAGTNEPWTVTVKVTPGRHLYAFMVDGKLVVDPRAPRARDIDYGGDASVMMAHE